MLPYKFWKRIILLSEIELEAPIRKFFISIIQSKSDPQINECIENILNIRKNLAEEHLAYLLWVAFQYVNDLLNIDTYDNIQILNLFKEKIAQIHQLCLINNVITNLPSRYAALQIMLSLLKNNSINPIRVLDLGCSLGMGLRALNTPIVRGLSTSNNEIYNLLQQQTSAKLFVGVDIFDINNIDWKWVNACFYPNHMIIDGCQSIHDVYNWLFRYGTPIKYVQCNIFDSPRLISLVKPGSFDLIWSSNLLFQIGKTPTQGLRKMLPIIQALLKENGIWINADYTNWNNNFGGGENRYMIVARHKLHLTRAYTVMTAPDDRVFTLEMGKDFKLFFETIRE